MYGGRRGSFCRPAARRSVQPKSLPDSTRGSATHSVGINGRGRYHRRQPGQSLLALTLRKNSVVDCKHFDESGYPNRPRARSCAGFWWTSTRLSGGRAPRDCDLYGFLLYARTRSSPVVVGLFTCHFSYIGTCLHCTIL